MNQTGNTETEMRIKRLLGAKGAAYIRTTIEIWLRLISFAPLQCLRLFGPKMLGAKIGKDVMFAPGVTVLSPWRLSIGSHTCIGRHVNLDSRGDLTIGDNVNISEEVGIWTAEHDIQSTDFCMTRGPVVIENRVWICFRSIILPGVKLGEGCIVASGAVVTKDVAPYSVMAGVPARRIGSRSKELTYQLGRPKTTLTADKENRS